jgi:hypothetical protein
MNWYKFQVQDSILAFVLEKGFTAIWLFLAFIEIESIIKFMRKNAFKLRTSSTFWIDICIGT